ncbi:MULTISPECIES: hypothetical protein [unclassified Kitasatospora]|uniref:hypothetical protein n=1 Tax=unclassified Kitasatospora TaxID=2633591 RepID=UPI00070F5E1A|nr:MULTISPECIES: hypothetical protein [unclassified Kitasatospora]KQV08744.1 hypothetical protein ASC99_36410 [Kitasatospora sp. Root107]KRB68877.1 hypothetical protein ASE03_28670 [Kitasatospora sp. Root187]
MTPDGSEKRVEYKADGTGGADEKDAAGVRLVEDLVSQVPGFEDAYECHVFNEHEVLSYLFFWDVVQDTVRSYLGEGDADGPDWLRVLAFLEEETSRRVPGAFEVIVTSFLYNLPYEGQPGYGVEAHLGPAMKEKYLQLRPWYGAEPSGAGA